MMNKLRLYSYYGEVLMGMALKQAGRKVSAAGLKLSAQGLKANKDKQKLKY